MTDSGVLYLAILVVYFLDALQWVRPGAVILLTGRLRLRPWLGDGDLFGGRQGGLALLEPVLPLGRSFLTFCDPVWFTGDGVLLGGRAAPGSPGASALSTRFVAYAAVETVEYRDRELFINGQPVVSLSSPAVAREAALRLSQLCDLPAAARSEAVQRFHEQHWDVAEAEGRWRRFCEAMPALRFSAGVFAVWLLVLAPVQALRFGLARSLVSLALCGVGLLGLLCWQFWACHRRLFPEQRAARRRQVLTALVCPPGAPRLTQAVSCDLFAGLHPLVAASQALTPEAFARLAAEWLRRLDHAPAWPGEAAAASSLAMAGTRQQLVGLLRQRGLDPAVLLAPPPRRSPDAVAYCPCCLAEYRDGSARSCVDCAGVALRPYASPPAAGAP